MKNTWQINFKIIAHRPLLFEVKPLFIMPDLLYGTFDNFLFNWSALVKGAEGKTASASTSVIAFAENVAQWTMKNIRAFKSDYGKQKTVGIPLKSNKTISKIRKIR